MAHIKSIGERVLRRINQNYLLQNLNKSHEINFKSISIKVQFNDQHRVYYCVDFNIE